MRVVAPRSSAWCEVLPEPWRSNPYVVVVMAPVDAYSKTVQTKDNYSLGVLECNGRMRGLQVIHPQLATWPAHDDIFKAARIPMADPAYIGRLAGLNQDLLLSDDFVPLVFQRDAMWRPYLHLRRHIAGITKPEEANVN